VLDRILMAWPWVTPLAGRASKLTRGVQVAQMRGDLHDRRRLQHAVDRLGWATACDPNCGGALWVAGAWGCAQLEMSGLSRPVP